MEKYKRGVGISAGCLMLKWNTLTAYMERGNVGLNPNAKVNVFINFESVIRNVSMQMGINELIQFYKQDVVLELEAGILNLVAHYKSYYNARGYSDIRIFLYYSDINASEYMMKEYNKYYRDFYRNKYTQNPKCKFIGEIMTSIIIPEVTMILSYVPNCYLIKTTTFDSSVVPMVVSQFDKSYENVIISSDVFDSLYLLNDDFITLYIKRRFSVFKIVSDIEAAVQSIIPNEDMFQLSILYNPMYYKLLLSIKGSKIRNIKSAKGFGYMKFVRLMNDAIEDGRILKEFKSIDSVIDIFPEKYRDDIRSAFICTDLDFQYSLLSDIDKEGIKNQMIDLEDRDSVESLNNVRFANYNINIQGLLQ